MAAVDAIEASRHRRPLPWSSSRARRSRAALRSTRAATRARLYCAAAAVLGVFAAIDAAHVARPAEAVYNAHQVFAALMAAWGAGYGSLEAMHERDARALGVILGIERSPSVRTLHRAIALVDGHINPREVDANSPGR